MLKSVWLDGKNIICQCKTDTEANEGRTTGLLLAAK